jgi:DNA-binding transcriptional LysR family regulator
MSMLVGVTETGSLSAAGRKLKVPLATLSRKISALEDHLGTRLLIRTTRKLTLTDSGIAYVNAARRILAQLEDAETEAAGEFLVPKGELVITAPLQFGQMHVLPVVVEFLASFPEINVRLVLADRNVDLIDAHVDMAVRIGKLPDSSMVATQIGLMRTVVCASPILLKKYGIPKSPQELSQLPCVTADAPMPTPGWQFRIPKSGRVLEIAIAPRLSVSTTAAAAEAAISGVGFTRLLHYQVADALRDNALRLVLTAFEPAPAPVSLVHVQAGQMALKMRRFRDFATPLLSDALREVAGSAGRK